MGWGQREEINFAGKVKGFSQNTYPMPGKKLLTMTDVTDERQLPSPNQLKHDAIISQPTIETLHLLWQAHNYWFDLLKIRYDGERCRRYYFGDAWGDYIEVDGRRMREKDYIRMQGKVPLQSNVIRRLGRNVVGLYRDEDKQPVCVARDKDEQDLGGTMSELLSYNWELNNLRGVYARSLEYFLIYGVVAHRHWYGWKDDKCDVWQQRLDVNRLFWDTTIEQDNAQDATMMGYIHDMQFDTLVSRFAHNEREAGQLRELYRYASNRDVLYNTYNRFGPFGNKRFDEYDFFAPSDPNLCRVIEVWTREQKARYHCHDWLTGECYKIEVEDKEAMVDAVNNARIAQYAAAGVGEGDVPLIETEWMMDSYWYYRFLTPLGQIIEQGETPYLHQKAPICIKLYPMINGTVRSFVADLIDIQRMINRLITKYDWILSASAQGNLIMDAASISDKMPLEQIANNWARVGGVVLYDSKKGTLPAPQQVSANNVNIGIMELLNVQLKMIEDISSVNGALQGKPGYAGISGTAYQQQTQNSTKGLLDLLETFDEFVIDNEKMDVKNIQQFYDAAKVKRIAGSDAADTSETAEKVLNADYDLSIAQSTSSPTYKERANEWLMQLLQQGVIGVEQLLKVGNFPFGEQLLQELQQSAAQAGGNMPSPARSTGGDILSPEMRQQVEQGVNMDAVNRLYQALRKE